MYDWPQKIVADLSVQAVISTLLKKSFPFDPLIGEEDSQIFSGNSGENLASSVLEIVNSVLKEPLSLSEVI